MHCPEHGLIIRKHLQIWHHQRADVDRKYVTWGEILNPLRYEIAFGPGPGRYWYINHDIWIWIAIRNVTFKAKAGCWLRGHDWYELNGFAPHSQPTLRCNKCGKLRAVKAE